MIDPTYAPHVYTRSRTWRRWRERERENERMRENEREREREKRNIFLERVLFPSSELFSRGVIRF